MNDLVKAVLNHDYANPSMKKQACIYKRTRKVRIKDKVFKKLFVAFVAEKRIAKIGEVVLLDIGIYRFLEEEIKKLEENLATAEYNRTENGSGFNGK